MLIKLAKKYNVKYERLTYKQLYDYLHKLYKLQVLANKNKIPITYIKKLKDDNIRKYKTIKLLETNLNKNVVLQDDGKIKRLRTQFRNNNHEMLIKLAKKYNVKYEKLTYKELYNYLDKLHKLQALANKNKIPITYIKKLKDDNIRKYKTIKVLETNLNFLLR